MKLAELAKLLKADLVGDPDTEISSVATLEDAQPGQVSFLSNLKYQKLLDTTLASAVIVKPDVVCDRVALLKVPDPYYAFVLALMAIHGNRKHPHAGIHPNAHVDPTASIGQDTVLYPGVYVGPRAKIGRDCILYPNVTVYDDCVIGDRVIIHAGCVIGSDGFGHATHGGSHHKIPQVGNVIIEDDVEMGANNTIDRAALGSTIIGKGTRMGDLNNIAHGVKIGPHCLLAGSIAIAGSTTIGHHVTLAGQIGIAGHLKIGDHVTIGAQTAIFNHVESGATMMGLVPALPAMQARRSMFLFTQLPEIFNRLKALEKRLDDPGNPNDANQS